MDDPQQQGSDSDAPQSTSRAPALDAPRAGSSTLRVMDTEATPGQQRLDSSLTIMAHSVDMMAFSQQDTTKQFAVQVGGCCRSAAIIAGSKSACAACMGRLYSCGAVAGEGIAGSTQLRQTVIMPCLPTMHAGTQTRRHAGTQPHSHTATQACTMHQQPSSPWLTPPPCTLHPSCVWAPPAGARPS
jgi:hypothetical protein